METCILDLSQITYSWDTPRKILTMYSPTKEILTEVVIDQEREISDREAAFTACEKALDRSKIKRHAQDGKVYKVNLALYNPLSKEISVGSSQYNKIYSGVPLNIPAHGLLAKEVDDEFILENGQHLYKIIPDFNHVTRILHTHREN